MFPRMVDNLADRLDPARLMRRLGFEPDPWQEDVLRSTDDHLLLLCSRQSGKSTTTAVLGLGTALQQNEALVLLLSPTLRQSRELFLKATRFYTQLGKPVAAVQETVTEVVLANGSRIVCLPGSADTIRGFSAPRLVVIDEAAITGDELFTAAVPMLAASPDGRLVCLSSPKGQRGWFFEQWNDPKSRWRKVKATAADCPRISRESLESQRRDLGDWRFRQELLCEFLMAENQVFSTEAVLAAFDCDDAPFPIVPSLLASDTDA